MKFKSMSCTKLRNFFEGRTVSWMVDNLTLEDIDDLARSIKACSEDAYKKASKLLKFAAHKIHSRR